ncbi:sigma-70 family RNA polymerase sigma factor [Streptomyces sp. NPDC058758]|uniref:sigma-70 family RNA polymerase sigma factor n=1 Tax=Streptomyces sp. NPDC058758 TaxID=3346627 RepID=UPI0036CCC7F6
MTLDLRAALAGLHRNLQRIAVDGVVPAGAFEAEVAHLGLDEAARSRLAAELERMGLRAEVRPAGAAAPSAASGTATVSAPSTAARTPATPDARGAGKVAPGAATGILLDLVARYAVEGAVAEHVVAGVARLAGLGTADAAALRTGAAARFTVRAEHAAGASVAASAPASAGGADGSGGETAHETAHEDDAEAGAPEPASASDGPVVTPDGLDAAVAAALRVLDEDRFTRRPEKIVLAADEEVGLSVLLRGGVDLVGVEPTAEELAALPPGDVRRRARDCLIAHNQGLVHSLARKHVEQGLDYEDVFQHGVVGLLNAVRKYDPLQGNKLSTYATWWIRQAMSRAVADEGSLIRVPVHMHETMQKVARAERQLLSAGHYPTLADVAVACDLPLDKVRQVRRVSKVTDSLDRVIGDGTSLGELVEGRNAIPSVEGTVLQQLADEDVHRLVALLPERYAYVVDRRVGLSGQDPATLDVIGTELKVTRERVRQLEAHVLPVLRLALEAPGEAPYAALRAMLADPRVGSNPVGAISRDLKGVKWGAGVVALRAFHARTGHTYPAPDHHEDGFPLGEWMAEQRALAKADGSGLPLHRKIVLGLAGVRWHPVAPVPPAPRRRRPIPGPVRPRPAAPEQPAAAPEPEPARVPQPPQPPLTAEPEEPREPREPEAVEAPDEPEAPEAPAGPEALEVPERPTVFEAPEAPLPGPPSVEERLLEAERSLRELEADVVHRVAVARADERNKARAAIEAEAGRLREEAAARPHAPLEAGETHAREAQEEIVRLRETLSRTAKRYEERLRETGAAAALRTAELEEELRRARDEIRRGAEDTRREEATADARTAELEDELRRARDEIRLLGADARRAEDAAALRTAELEDELRRARDEIRRLTEDAQRERDAAALRAAELEVELRRARDEVLRVAEDGRRAGDAAALRTAELAGGLHRARAEAQRLAAEARAAEDTAAERVRAVERWAEQQVAEAREAARVRVAEAEARLAASRPAPAPAGPDPRKWWQRS